MPTASELGFLEAGNEPATALEAGLKLELTAEPELKESKENKEYVILKTKSGNYYSFGSAVIGALRSTNEKSIGGLLRRALEVKKTLTVWVVEHEANNNSGRMVIGLSAFAPSKRK